MLVHVSKTFKIRGEEDIKISLSHEKFGTRHCDIPESGLDDWGIYTRYRVGQC